MKGEELKQFLEGFAKDTKDHRLTVFRDDGIYRHLRFAAPGTRVMHFDLVTWPGHLCYSGDMGCFVFCRLLDMLEFFRRPEGKAIDYRYWAQKLVSSDRDGVMEYDESAFKAAIWHLMEQHIESYEDSLDPGHGGVVQFRKAVQESVLARANEGHAEAVRAAMEFEFGGRRPFRDIPEVEVRQYTHRFLWCCHALVWAINLYDRREVEDYSATLAGLPAKYDQATHALSVRDLHGAGTRP